MSSTLASLPKEITLKDNGDYRVCVYPIGANNPVRVTCKTLADAFEALAHGLRARDARATAEEIKHAMVNGIRAHRALSAPPPVTPRCLGVVLDDFLDDRQKICDVGNHEQRRNIKNGINSVRPRTMDTYRNHFEGYLRPRWGHVRIDQIDRQAVSQWMTALAEQGVGINTSRKLMIFLRKLVGMARRSELPEEFPWKEVEAIKPTFTIRPSRDPGKWGGTPGSKPPAMPIDRCLQLFGYVPSATQGALHLERFATLRVGEACGLLLSELTIDNVDRLRARIRRQMDDKGEIVEYVKSDASYRTIPFPHKLKEYLIAYCEYYHGYDLRKPDPDRWNVPLVVNRAGRALDGSFLPMRPTTLFQQLIDARVPAGMTHGEMGFTVGNHYFRECLITELLNVRVILGDQARLSLSDAPADPADRLAFLERLLNERLADEFMPMHVSSYAGHEHDGKSEMHGASAVTLKHYNLSLNTDGPWLAICDAVDRLIETTVGELRFEPDAEDGLPVHPIDDPEWCTVPEAIELIGIQDSNVHQAIHDGRLDGHMGWQANGGYRRNADGTGKSTPALAQWFISRTSIKEFIRKKCLVGTATVARRFGMTDRPTVRILTGAGLQAEGASKWNPDAVDAVHRQLHQLVLDALDLTPCSLKELKVRIDKSEPEVLPERRVTLKWLEVWCDQLRQAGAITVKRDGRFMRKQ